MNNFINLTMISETVCDDLISLHLTSMKSSGTIATPGLDNQSNHNSKNSIESIHSPTSDRLIPYFKELQQSLDAYIKLYPFCNNYGPFSIIENVKIQEYNPGGGYLDFHTERGSCQHPNSSRHLVFMTYLNSIKVGGGTKFFHQNTETIATKGLTVIWPADWTHTHKGITAPEETKYIITGWYNFIK
jgi:hypothetical protein